MPASQATPPGSYVVLAIATAMVTLPFLNPVHPLPLPTFHEEAGAMALGLCALLLSGLSLDTLAIANIAPAIAVLGALMLLQSVVMPLPSPEIAQLHGLVVLWASAMACVGATLRRGLPEEVPHAWLATGLVLAALVSAAASWHDPLAFLRQPNLHANYEVVGMASLAYLWVSGRVRPRLALAGMLPMIASVGIAASRASVLEMAWVAGVMAVFLVRGRGFRMRRVVGYAALVALIAAAVILALSTGPSAIFLGKLGAAFHSRELHVRYVEWEAALRAWMAAPWFGVGAGGYPWAQFTTETPWAGEVRMLPETHAHNFILHLLAETGLVGAVVALIALVPWLWRICRTMLQPGDTAGPAWVLAVVGIELLHSLVEYPLWNVEFLGLAALAAGLGGEARVLPRAMTGIRLIACGGALLGAALLGRTVYAFGFLERAWFGAALPEQVAEARKSLLRPYVDLGLAQQVPLTRADLSAKLVFNSRAVMTWPVAPVVMRQIVLLAMAGRDEEAKVYLHRLSRLNRAYLADLRTMVEAVSLDDLPAASPLRSLVHAEST